MSGFVHRPVPGPPGTCPMREIDRQVDLCPYRPLKWDGIRVDPPISEPKSNDVRPAAVATAPPPADPPEVRVVSHGFAEGPNTGLSAWTSWLPGGMLLFPMI